MTPELKSISTLEISSPLEEYFPDDIYSFSLELDLVIGSKGLEGGDFFSITVTTFKYLNIDKNEPISLEKGYLIIDKYDYYLIESKLSTFIRDCSGENWQIIATNLSKVFYWEFENYTV